MLQSRYGFETVILQRPTKARVQQEWDRLRSKLNPNDRFVMVLSGLSTRESGKHSFALQPTGTSEMLSGEEIRDFFNSIRAGQSLLVAASSYTGMLIGDPVAADSKNEAHQSILALTASDAMNHSWSRDSADKLLTPLLAALQSASPPLNGPFDSEVLSLIVQKTLTQQLQENALKVPGQSEGPIQFGPLAGSHHAPGARFYFPHRRSPPEIASPAAEAKPAEKADEPAPTK